MDIERYIKSLSPELQEKARGCKSTEELFSLAQQEGVALPDETMAAIAGGDSQEVGDCNPPCPRCGSNKVVITSSDDEFVYYKCDSCGYKWSHHVVH